jgi:hypothetical protein
MNSDEQVPSGLGPGPEPIEPGGSQEPRSAGAPSRPLKKNRGDLVVLLGIGSLFCCPPLGLLAWIMARSDLKRIREGEMSSDGIGALRAGRVLGIVGTVFFLALLALSIFAASRLPGSYKDMKGLLHQKFELFKKDVEQDLKPHPLTREQLPYVGLWVGDRGTKIKITKNGVGDYEYHKDRMTGKQTGGRVRIEGNKLSIGIFGIYSTWKIDQAPTEADGTWTMVLDGEKFTRKGIPRPEPREMQTGPGPREYDI